MFLYIEDIWFKYDKEFVLKGVDFQISKGETVAILGESGSGKSTILRIIAGFERQQKGIIRLEDQILSSKNKFLLPEKRHIGFVFQDYALFPHMTVKQNIEYAKKGKYKNMLKLVDLEGFENRYPHELSGGQQQRVALARTLAVEPKLLLLDEPFSNLDEMLKDKIRNDLKNILKKAKITTIIVTHDKNDAYALANKIITLKDGKVENIENTKIKVMM
ncbi:iron(III) transport system ATP-binding protein [Marinitoga hydrogenitolerans DSM 16785]|uniref:Iron(III) transport system ATP-binding protein n=1 Tax=Marinitoga hydrogenitolerans (strain DSM 16785 / JCM 12826 / AT1271) TaxID=1122195 RepID=A0A1M4V9K9_MARH1|nr:ABC transporter ATP-binding protein [Marinitoga hydrogenitolerans]SHE65635.1 iron(III) transport system ATP-binding protein [Marinitoga hydrogenitolerans DSM 16785]